MLTRILIVLLLGLPAAARAQETEPLKVVATMPTYAALAHEIGGDLVEVTTICRPTQDPHGVTGTPSLVERIRGADLLLHTGLDVELWLDQMLRASGNLDLLPGGARAVDMSAGVHLKDVPSQVDRSRGDVHALGNPHVWTDPLNVRLMAGHVRDALVDARPGQREAIEQRAAAFHTRLTTAIVDWLTRYAGLKGKHVVVHHRSWVYFLDRFGLVEAAALEPKPRVAPTASHLSSVIEVMKAHEVRAVLREPWQAPDAADFVAEATGARVLELAQHPEPAQAGDGIIRHVDEALTALADALDVEVPDKR
ncbi:MAG: metal ABC transporter substrate-binding protein [Planctomycetota bacterium]|jgi:zinc/manganese transport system substrate-binding protein